MARHLKNGVDYFPMDTDFFMDDTVRMLRVECGAKGMYALQFLLCELYRQYGYYLPWDEIHRLLLSDGAGCDCDPDFLQTLVDACVRHGFFGRDVYAQHGVLTSRDIQQRYVRMFNYRKSLHLIGEYWLLNADDPEEVPASIAEKIVFRSVSPEKNAVSPMENAVSPVGNGTNKNKINKSKANKTHTAPPVPAELADAWGAYVHMRKKFIFP